MSSLADAIKAIRDVLLLQSQVARLEDSLDESNEELKRIARDVLEIDKRVVRIETMIEFGSRQGGQARIEG